MDQGETHEGLEPRFKMVRLFVREGTGKGAIKKKKKSQTRSQRLRRGLYCSNKGEKKAPA